MAIVAISHFFRLICLSLFLVTNISVKGVDIKSRDETLVVTSTSVPLHLSLGYPSDNNCKQKLVPQQKEILIISTLDGKLSALDVKSGEQIWSKPVNSEPLLSSTISKFEITRKGRIVRVVPSLDGNLYLYNGKTIDGIPLNAEVLLKSSFKLGDDLVITGGQESQISGIDITSGKVYYECGLKGCPSSPNNENETFDDLFLLKRITQTVRAIDPRNGRQKWFFSVTEPQISETSFSNCDENGGVGQNDENTITESSSSDETDFNIIVPNGFIAVRRYSESDSEDNFHWNYRFGSPIVHVWHYRSGRISSIDLFDKRKLFGSTNIDPNLNDLEPSVYIGLYDHQWYVQSSDAIKAQMDAKNRGNNLLTSETKRQIDSKSNILQIEWKPNAIIFDVKDESKYEESLGLVASPKFSLSISSAENEENVGYYIFDAIEDNETKCMANSGEEPNDWDFDEYETDNDLIQQIVIASLSYYWKEVTLISIFAAIVLNFLFSMVKRKFRECIEPEIDEINETPDSKSKSVGSSLTPTPSQCDYNENNFFNSRYETDFQPIQLLGKGGFGLVFEAKHMIDESHYAVKRISLPIRKEQREKVMREVRALSKLEHPGIVRYYNAWVEFPPPGWQENKDKQWDIDEEITKTQFNESLISNNKGVSHLSFRRHRTTETFSESGFGFNSSQIITKSESNQSFDIVFDDNISSIKLVENNCQTKSEVTSFKSHIFDFTEESEDNEPIEASERPTSLKTGSVQRFYLYIQMQLCRKETLKDWLFANSVNRDLSVALDIFDQIVSAVHYVHSMGLMHRDLKPTNIFFSMDGNIKIGDFGLVTATAVDDETHTPAENDCEDAVANILQQNNNSHTNRVGTQLYMSPEQVKNLPYSHKVDIFSMGIILFELLTPFKTEMERNLLLNGARKQLFAKEFCETFVSECDLLKRLLAHNPDNRPTTNEIRGHEVLKKLQSIDGVKRQRSRTLSFTSNSNH